MEKYYKDILGKLIKTDYITGRQTDITENLNFMQKLELIKAPNGQAFNSRTDLLGNVTLSYNRYCPHPINENTLLPNKNCDQFKNQPVICNKDVPFKTYEVPSGIGHMDNSMPSLSGIFNKITLDPETKKRFQKLVDKIDEIDENNFLCEKELEYLANHNINAEEITLAPNLHKLSFHHYLIFKCASTNCKYAKIICDGKYSCGREVLPEDLCKQKSMNLSDIIRLFKSFGLSDKKVDKILNRKKDPLQMWRSLEQYKCGAVFNIAS